MAIWTNETAVFKLSRVKDVSYLEKPSEPCGNQPHGMSPKGLHFGTSSRLHNSRAFRPVMLNISNLISREIAPPIVWPQNSLDSFHCISLSSCELWKFVLISCGVCTCGLDSKENIRKYSFYKGYRADSSLHDKLPLRPSAEKPAEKHWLLPHIPSWLLSLLLVYSGQTLMMLRIHLMTFVVCTHYWGH